MGMGKSSSADLPDLLRGVVSVLEHLPGLALLVDAEGRVIFGNDAFRALQRDAQGDAAFRISRTVLQDTLGTDQTTFHALDLPDGGRSGVACVRLTGDRPGERYVMIREDTRRAVVAKFVNAQEGLLRSQLERDRALQSEQRMRAEAAHWRQMSMSDRLTGLFNATGFRDRAVHALKQGKEGVFLYADLNGFKQVNDTLGHARGDDLLKDIGQSLNMAVRSGDLAARIGGDEFAVFLPDCPAQDLPGVVDRLRAAMTRRIPVRGQGETPGRLLAISPAIGTALCPSEGQDLDSLLRLADSRMYGDKARCRDQMRRNA